MNVGETEHGKACDKDKGQCSHYLHLAKDEKSTVYPRHIGVSKQCCGMENMLKNVVRIEQ